MQISIWSMMGALVVLALVMALVVATAGTSHPLLWFLSHARR
jgi:hypothetical protein